MENYKLLVEFIRKCESNDAPRPLKQHLVEELLRQIINGDREITGMATNPKTGEVYVSFGFTTEEPRRATGEDNGNAAQDTLCTDTMT